VKPYSKRKETSEKPRDSTGKEKGIRGEEIIKVTGKSRNGCSA
jgi:hypothetical protein